ncbi:MAG: DUF2460 domain-containing protein [Desulfobaccales bacterium]
MSNAVFPILRGFTYPVIKKPTFSTIEQESVSGIKKHIGNWVYPRWQIEIPVEFLLDDVAHNELKTLVGFFLSRQGRFDSFLFDDPDDDFIQGQELGIGNGATTAFQLLRAYGGFIEPCLNIKSAPVSVVYLNGVPQYGPNLIISSTFLGQNFDGWWNPVPDYLAGSIVPPGNGFALPALRWDATGGVQDQRTAASSGAQSAPFTPGHTYLISFKYQAGGPFTIRDWYIQVIASLPANLGPALPFSCYYTDPITNTSDETPYFYFFLADSGICPYIEIGELSIQDVGGPLPYAIGYTDSGLLTFTTPPAAGAVITADFGYYWRCIFQEDLSEFDKFMNQLWEHRGIKIETVK